MLLNFIIYIMLVLIDQASKYIVNVKIDLYKLIEVIPSFFYLTNVRNTGAAWSILEGKRYFFIILAIAAVMLIFYFLYREKNVSFIYRLSLILLAGGATGNMVDRIVNGYVTDFLDFYIFGYNYPVFNFADICITIGVVLLFIDMFFNKESSWKN